MEIRITPENDPRNYVGYTMFGAPFNKKYPPDVQKYGSCFEGYATKAEGVLFYDFAVMGYDVEFTYKGKKYYLLDDGEAFLSDARFTEQYEAFTDPMDLVEHLMVDGRPLLDIIPEITDIEPV
jgi:hypothetical protein